jgi:hypothetical protein
MKAKFTYIGLLIPAIVIALLSVSISACKKADVDITDTTKVVLPISEANAADMIAEFISPANAGFVTQIDDAINLKNWNGVYCGLIKDTTIVRSSTTPVAYAYNFKWKARVNCSGLFTDGTSSSCDGTGEYNGVNYSSKGQYSGVVFIGYPWPKVNYKVSSNFTGTVITKSKASGQVYNTTIKLTAFDAGITFDKKIISGTSKIDFMAEASGKEFKYAGNINFTGANTADLVLNSGTVYKITW